MLCALQQIHRFGLKLAHSYHVSTSVRAALYARISADLEQEGKGVTRQLKDCHELAAKNEWTVVQEYVDNDISAYSDRVRPAYEKLQEDMRAGHIDVVVAWSADRLFRRTRQLEDWIDLCEATAITIHSVQQGSIDVNTPAGRVVARALTAFSAFEVENLRARVKRKALELAHAGAWPGQRVYGYLADGSIVPHEAQVIREMADRILSGEGYNEVARDLDGRSVAAPRGGSWRASTIQSILKAPRIAGLRVHNGEVVARGNWDPIVSEETSMLLRARLAPGGSGARGGPRKHLLVGILVCGRCGTGMVRGYGGKTRTPNYRCPKNQGSTACGRMTIVADKVEEWIFEAACFALDNKSVVVESDTSTWEEQTRVLAQRREALGQDFAKGLIDRLTVISATKAIRAQEASLTPPTSQGRRLDSTGEQLRSAWPSMSVANRRASLEGLFEKVVVNTVLITTGKKIFDPRRLSPVWRV